MGDHCFSEDFIEIQILPDDAIRNRMVLVLPTTVP